MTLRLHDDDRSPEALAFLEAVKSVEKEHGFSIDVDSYGSLSVRRVAHDQFDAYGYYGGLMDSAAEEADEPT